MEDKRLLRLVKRARRGDSQAFSELITLKSRMIVYIATKLMGNKADGEDAAQEAVLMLARKISSLKNPELFDAWMYRIVYNICMDEKRRQSKNVKQSAELEIAIATVAESSSEAIPEQNLHEAIQRENIMDAINQLPERYRLCLTMFYFEDMTYTEIARSLQVSEQVVANTLNRARTKLRDVLSESMREEELPPISVSNLPVQAADAEGAPKFAFQGATRGFPETAEQGIKEPVSQTVKEAAFEAPRATYVFDGVKGALTPEKTVAKKAKPRIGMVG